MSRSLVEKIGWELDDLQNYIKEIENESTKNDMDFIVSNIRDYLDEIVSEIDDINRCLERII